MQSRRAAEPGTVHTTPSGLPEREHIASTDGQDLLSAKRQKLLRERHPVGSRRQRSRTKQRNGELWVPMADTEKRKKSSAGRTVINVKDGQTPGRVRNLRCGREQGGSRPCRRQKILRQDAATTRESSERCATTRDPVCLLRRRRLPERQSER